MPGSHRLYFAKTETYQYSPELEKEFSASEDTEPEWAKKAAAAMIGLTNHELRHANKWRKFWNGSEKAFLAGSHKTEWGHVPLSETNALSDDWPWDLYEDMPRRGPMVLKSLLDIARPAKRKGAVKDYEIVDLPAEIIALDEIVDTLPVDDVEVLDWYSSESDWEIVNETSTQSHQCPSKTKGSYASAVKGR